MSLSDKLRPDVECAPWVIEEVKRLERERDKAQANYQFMVERAADQRLDGYRELGARAAAAENELDRVRANRDAYEEACRLQVLERADLEARLKQALEERDEACEELETLRALIEGEPWAGAVMRRERDKAREELDDARESVTKAHEALRAAEKREIEAVQELDEAAALLREAHRELSSIEAITVSPTGVDGLLDLANRMHAFLGKATTESV